MAELKDVQLFHFGYPCFMAKTYENEGAELIRMYKTVHDMGITTSMDPGMPDPNGPAGKVDWKKLLSKVLPYTDVFMPSADELLYMMMPERFGDGDNIGVQELEKLGDELIGFGAAVVAIKLGQRGMYRPPLRNALHAWGQVRQNAWRTGPHAVCCSPLSIQTSSWVLQAQAIPA